MQALNRQQVRDVDRLAVDEYGMSGLVLMENAGRGAADVLCGLLDAKAATENATTGHAAPVVICCGKGNNAGDGFVIARHLELRQVPVRVLLLANPKELTGDAAANFRILTKCDVPIVICCWPSWKRFRRPSSIRIEVLDSEPWPAP